jgi:hypothetical protein
MIGRITPRDGGAGSEIRFELSPFRNDRASLETEEWNWGTVKY